VNTWYDASGIGRWSRFSPIRATASTDIVAAFGKASNEPRFVQARHEEMAALDAVGYAKFGGKAGVCMATSGPGKRK
jgi:thiamine pyrophosphate-dependent acetolactate synthase large subunit-like protein